MLLRVLAGLLALLSAGAAAQPASVPRVGFLDPTPSSHASARIEQFKAGMKALGHQEGRTYVLEYRSAEGRFEKLPELAAELVRLPVKVLVTRTTPGTRAARSATQSTPIVIGDVGDPLGLGFVKTLARPGGNITGVSNATLELIRKRLEIMREVLPSLSRVAILGNSDDPNTPLQIKEAQAAAKALGIEARVFDARNIGELEPVLKEIRAWNAQAVVPLVHPLRQAMTPRISAWARAERLPVIFPAREDLSTGGLMAFSADLSAQWQSVAAYVDRILKGANPADMAVERPSRYLLAINVATAKAIGLTIPPAVMVRADEILQ
jgi:putative tryptophan/tyrosine transport system substrate-binding protein